MTTIEKVKAIQTKLGLSPDGVVGPKTVDGIYDVVVGTRDQSVQAQPPAVVDGRSAATIDTLIPEVREAFRNLLLKANAEIFPHVWKWTSGTRTYLEQAKLHDAFLQGGPQATSPGNSAHNFGIACDGTVFGPSGPIWDGPDYAKVGALARSLGFHWGADFGDEPHFCLRPPSCEKMKELEMMAELRRRHENKIPIWP